MKDYHLKIIEDALLSLYGEEEANKIHSGVPAAQLVKSLAWDLPMVFGKLKTARVIFV